MPTLGLLRNVQLLLCISKLFFLAKYPRPPIIVPLLTFFSRIPLVITLGTQDLSGHLAQLPIQSLSPL